jgi:hypothetical protein
MLFVVASRGCGDIAPTCRYFDLSLYASKMKPPAADRLIKYAQQSP